MQIGTFQAKPIEGALCASGKGTEYVGVEFEIVDGPCAGETIAGSLWWTEKTQESTKRSLAAMGWKGEVDREAKLVGLTNTVPIGVVEEEYNGRKSFKIGWVVQPPNSGINAKDRLTLSAAKRFAAELSGNNGGNGQRQAPRNGTAPGRTQSGYVQGDAYEDDI